MKNEYQLPDFEIERFDFSDIITLSDTDRDDGIGAPDQVEDPWNI